MYIRIYSQCQRKRKNEAKLPMDATTGTTHLHFACLATKIEWFSLAIADNVVFCKVFMTMAKGCCRGFSKRSTTSIM